MLFKVKSVEKCNGQVSVFRGATRLERRQELWGGVENLRRTWSRCWADWSLRKAGVGGGGGG